MKEDIFNRLATTIPETWSLTVEKVELGYEAVFVTPRYVSSSEVESFVKAVFPTYKSEFIYFIVKRDNNEINILISLN